MIECKEEFNDLINRLKAKEKENKLGKSLQIKLRAFKEVEELINKLTIPVVSQRSELLSEEYENKLDKGVKELKEAMKKQGIYLP